MDRKIREAIVWLLVQRLGDSGKTKIVKLLFLLQEVFAVPMGYRFRMHHYGPYAFDVEDDLTALEVAGKLRVVPDALGYGYHLTALREPEGPGFDGVGEYDEELSRVVSEYGGESVNSLEILTTVVFLNQITGSRGEALASRVAGFKPRYSIDFIRDAVKRAESASLLRA